MGFVSKLWCRKPLPFYCAFVPGQIDLRTCCSLCVLLSGQPAGAPLLMQFANNSCCCQKPSLQAIATSFLVISLAVPLNCSTHSCVGLLLPGIPERWTCRCNATSPSK